VINRRIDFFVLFFFVFRSPKVRNLPKPQHHLQNLTFTPVLETRLFGSILSPPDLAVPFDAKSRLHPRLLPPYSLLSPLAQSSLMASTAAAPPAEAAHTP
jgi:hypothetical protein